VYIALAFNGGTEVKRIQLFGERARIREIASLQAFDFCAENSVRSKITRAIIAMLDAIILFPLRHILRIAKPRYFSNQAKCIAAILLKINPLN
jgi:hypothetical protein